MWARIWCVASAIALVPVAAAAQDGLRSASLPERNLTSTFKPVREDVHQATDETYRPRPDRIPAPFVFGYQGPLMYPVVQPIIVVQLSREAVESARAAPAPAPAAPAPYVAGTPGRPKTFYVIPGCYAGDRPPDADSLVAGCNRSRLRIVPPS